MLVVQGKASARVAQAQVGEQLFGTGILLVSATWQGPNTAQKITHRVRRQSLPGVKALALL